MRSIHPRLKHGTGVTCQRCRADVAEAVITAGPDRLRKVPLAVAVVDAAPAHITADCTSLVLDQLGEGLGARREREGYRLVEVLDNALKGKETANFEFPLYTKAGTKGKDASERVEILLNAATRRDARDVLTNEIDPQERARTTVAAHNNAHGAPPRSHSLHRPAVLRCPVLYT